MLSHFGSDFASMFNSMHQLSQTHAYSPARAHVPTISFNAKITGCESIFRYDIDALRAVPSMFDTIATSDFSNSTVRLATSTLHSVVAKLFTHGSVQVSGCKNHIECVHVLQSMCQLLDAAYPGGEQHRTFEGIRVTMFNMNISNEFGVSLTTFAREARSRGMYAEQPERPPSCILRVKEGAVQTTAMVYKTGKIVLSTKTTEQCLAMFTFIYAILNECPATTEVLSDDVKARSAGRFHFTQLIESGMPGTLHTHLPCTSLPVPGCLRCKYHPP